MNPANGHSQRSPLICVWRRIGLITLVSLNDGMDYLQDRFAGKEK